MTHYTDVYPTELPKNREAWSIGEVLTAGVSLVMMSCFALTAAVALFQSCTPQQTYNPSTQEGCFTRGDKVICVYEAEEDNWSEEENPWNGLPGAAGDYN